MSACIGMQQHDLLLLLKQHPQLLPASSHWVRCLQVVQQLLHMAEIAKQKGFGVDDRRNKTAHAAATALGQQQQQQQEQLLQQMTLVGQQIRQAMSMQQQQQVLDQDGLVLRQQQLALLQQLHQHLQQLQQQYQQLQQHQQSGQSSLLAAQQLARQNPQLLLVPPESILAHVATMQAQSGLSVTEVAAVLVRHPHLLVNSYNTDDGDLAVQRQQRQVRQQGKQ